MRYQALLIVAAILPLAVVAQQAQPMGSVATRDATVTGGLEVQGERARLLTNAGVTAHDHTADIALARGGDVLVCSTSQFHLLRAGAGQALLFGLDRGALELHTRSDAHDVILTPDIRFTLEAPGEFDLRMRVMRNGDTCVDNAGKGPPVLILNAAFGGASYRLMPGQHVLFEHGNLREVVDHERTDCGCPKEAVLPANATAAQRAAAAHPFPEAEAEGLAPAQPINNDGVAGEKQTQITGVLAYGEGAKPPPVVQTDTSTAKAGAGTQSSEEQHGFFHAVGHFFHKLFHPGS